MMLSTDHRAAAQATLIQRPLPPPAIGAAYAGGFYTGAAWDTVTTGSGEYNFANLSVGSRIVLTIPADTSRVRHPFYRGQTVRIAPFTNTTQVFLTGTVIRRLATGLDVSLTDVSGTGTFSSWAIAARWKVILAPKDGGESAGNMTYKTANTADPGECVTLTNGRSAIAAMIAANTAAGSVIYPAANFIKTVNDAALSGYADWELPARDWLELMWRNLKPVTHDNFVATRPKSNSYIRDANTDDIENEDRGLNRHSVPAGGAYTAENPAQTPLALFQLGGAQAPSSGDRFWSSSEYSATAAWSQSYLASFPGSQVSLNKTSNYLVRAVRREIL